MEKQAVVISRSGRPDAGCLRVEEDLIARVRAAGGRALVVPHVYYLKPGHPALARLGSLSGAVVGTWLHPRAARWALHALGLPNADSLQCMRLDSDEFATACSAAGFPVGNHAFAVRRMPSRPNGRPAPGDVEEIVGRPAPRWYPVIDYSRCRSCRQCVEFCLFGVYSEEDGRAAAVRPDACKTGCPACARVCPHGAIIFPECDEPAIAGAEPQTPAAPQPAAAPRDPADGIDALIDELERLD